MRISTIGNASARRAGAIANCCRTSAATSAIEAARASITAGSASSRFPNLRNDNRGLRGMGRGRRRVRTAAQPGFQRRDHAWRRQLSARHRQALAHQFGIGVPASGRASAEPDGHYQRAGQQGHLPRTHRNRRGVDQERPDVRRHRRPRSHPVGGRVAVAATAATVGHWPGRICCAGSAFPLSPTRRRSDAICRITIRRA